MFLKNVKISTKITSIFAALFLTVLFVVNTSIYFGIRFYLQHQFAKDLSYVSTVIKDKLKAENDYNNISIFYDLPITDNYAARIIDSKNNVINSMSNFTYIAEVSKSLEYPVIYEDKIEQYTIIYKSIVLDNSAGTIMYLQVAKDITYEALFLDIVKVFMVTSCFTGLLFAVILGNIASKKMLAPIDRITKTAQSITSKNLKQRIRVSSKEDELSRLATTFNEMIDRIQDYVERQNQFVSDASHELRTPISVINGYVNLLDRWGKDDKEILDESITAIKNEIKNMTNLLEKLLFLARSDNGITKIPFEKFYLNELINEVIRESNLVQSNIIIESENLDEVVVNANSNMIKQLLRIFIDNSLKFTNDGGNIIVNLIKDESHCKLIIKDDGEGIPKEYLNKIFDRFYMVDNSREKQKGGSGLGLAIAKQIVLAHNGEIKVESRLKTENNHGGTIITVTLPM